MASEYIEDSSSEDREGYRRGGRGRGGRGSGRGGGRGSGGRGGRGRSSSSKGRGKGKSSSRAGRGAKSSARGKSRSRGAASRSAKASSAKSSAARSSRADSNAASNREAGRAASTKAASTKTKTSNKVGNMTDAQRKSTNFKAKTSNKVGNMTDAQRKSTNFKAKSIASKPSMADIAGPTKSKTKTKSNFKTQDKLRDANGMLTRAGVAANKEKKAIEKAKAANVDKASYDNLRSLAKNNTITNEQLRSLKDMNVKMGMNPTTGMGIVESFKYRGPQLEKDLNNLKDIYNKIPTPGNLAMKALGLFGKKPTDATAQVGAQSTGIGSIFDKIKSGFNRSPSTTPQAIRDPNLRRNDENRGGGLNNQIISDMLFRPAVNPGGIDGPFKQPSPTVMPGMENLQQLENRFGNNGIGTLLARAQSTPTSNYGYGPSATAGRENIDRLTAAPSYMPLSSFMTAADGGRAGYSQGGSGTDQQQRENFYDFGYDDFLSLEQYMGSAQAIRDLERNANGGRIGYQYGGTGAYPSGNVYGGNYAQGGQAQSGSPMHGGGYNQGGSPMVMMTGANSGLGNVLEHYKTIRGKM